MGALVVSRPDEAEAAPEVEAMISKDGDADGAVLDRFAVTKRDEAHGWAEVIIPPLTDDPPVTKVEVPKNPSKPWIPGDRR